MSYNFPNNPTEGQEYLPPVGGQTYVWHSPRWMVKGVPPTAGSGGGGGGIGEAPEDGKQYGRQVSTWTEVSWNLLAGKPDTFPPTLPINQAGVVNLVTDLSSKAPLDSPVFTGDARAVTPAATDNDTSIATTAFVQSLLTNGGVPAGAVSMFARNAPPTGWLKANGALVSRTAYAALFAAIGTQFGAGDGSTTFALPDLRGEFLRSWDDSRGVDTSRAFGTAQTGDTASHTHAISITSAGVSANHTHVIGGTTAGVSANHTHTQTGAFNSGTESADHVHYPGGDSSYNVVGWKSGGANSLGTTYSGGQPLYNFNLAGRSAAHYHATTISGQTGINSVSHTHTFSDTSDINSVGHTHGVNGTSGATGGTETRPRNIALLACIKY